MEKIVNEEHDCDQMTNADVVLGTIQRDNTCAKIIIAEIN